MRTTLDWSHDLLHEPEKELFRRLSVFAGGFTLEAAEDVCAAGAVEAEDVLAPLGNLAEQSLVAAETSPEGKTRYRMLEPVRQYALERLEESGEEDEVRRRHVRHYLALAEEAEPRVKGHEQVEWLDRLEAENDNLRAAIGWSLEAGDAPTAARFGWALSMYWVMRTRQDEGRLLMGQTLSQDDGLPSEIRAKALWALAACMYGSGDDERLMAVAEEGATLFRRAGDRLGEAYMLTMSGLAVMGPGGDLDRATRCLKEALELSREQGDAWGSAHMLIHLASVLFRRGDHPLAAGYAEEALALTRQTGDRFAANIALSLLAQMAWASDQHGRAARHWREALTVASQLTDKIDSAYCMQGLAMVAGKRDEPRRATRLLGAAEALLEAAGLAYYAHETTNQLHQHAASAARELLGDQAWTAAHDEGRAMGFDQAVAYALGETDADV
jgi:tetratricopeptide (TPR) repeat protein